MVTTPSKIYVDDVGTRVRTYLRADITEASGIVYNWKKPVSGATSTTEISQHSCEVEDYTSGVVYYDSDEGDFDVKGEYLHQVLVTFNNGDRFRSYTKSFTVYNEFE